MHHPANDRSFNRASLSSPRFIGCYYRLPLVWVTLLSAVGLITAARNSLTAWRASLLGALTSASDTYGFIQTSSTTGTFPLQYYRYLRCRFSRTVMEIGAAYPHLMQNYGQFTGTGHGDRRAAVPFRSHQFDRHF